MSGWLWLLLIFGLLGLLLCTRLKIVGQYGEHGGSLTVSFGILKLFTAPRKKREKKAGAEKSKAEKPQKDQKQKAEQKSQKGGSIPAFRELTGIVTTLLGKLRRRLCVDELTLWYLSAAEDPARAALAFGGANAAAGMLALPLEQVFRIKKRDIRTAVSFTETKPTVYACLRLSLSLFTILELGGAALFLLWKARRRAAKTEV